MPTKHKSSSPSAQNQEQNQKTPSNLVGESATANGKQMQPDAKAHANPPRAPAKPADKQWRDHEHQVSATPAQAQDMAKESGSPELAKHVTQKANEEVNATTPHATAPVSSSDKDDAARQVGFESFATLVEHSTAIDGERNRASFVCELSDGRWIRFERESWPKFEAFRTRDEAVPQPAAE